MKLKHAIIWPLTTDQSDFQPYYLSGTQVTFPEKLRNELQNHIAEILSHMMFENQIALKKARRFISYMPGMKDEDDTGYVVSRFVEVSDALAEEIGNNEQLAQWRVRLFER